MRFRFVMLGPEDDPTERVLVRKCAEGVANQFRTRWYEQRDTGMVRLVQMQNGSIKSTPLTNFTARIVRDININDVEQERREFGLEAEFGGHRIGFTVPVPEFGRMSWVLNRLGPKAIIYPGQQQHARAAIQWLSGEIRQERIFAHLGWRKDGNHWIYLHAEGAVDSEGTVLGVQVHVPRGLQAYQTQVPKDRGATVQAVRASLRCLSVAPDHLSFPLLAAIYRAPFGGLDFSVFLAGKSGVFKTALAALCQQHFGKSMDASLLPANFASTGNALESLAFQAKDTLLVVDDYAPTGQGDGGLHHVAERLFRSAGNTQGRSRLEGNGHVGAPKPARALLLATGEAVPSGQSIRARLIVIAMAAGDVDRMILSECQRAGQDGLLAESMGAFLSWIARQYQERQQCMQDRALHLRNCSLGRVAHARTPAAVAALQAGWEVFLEFALELGAVSGAEMEELVERSKTAFLKLATLQAQYQQAMDPTARFLALLEAALACGRGHVADRQGRAPAGPALWGWERKAADVAWTPQGIRIGWLAGSDLFLEPRASYQVAQEQAGSERLSVGEQSLRQRLRERGLLASIDEGRKMLQVRRSLEGSPRQVLHLRAEDLRAAQP